MNADTSDESNRFHGQMQGTQGHVQPVAHVDAGKDGEGLRMWASRLPT
jgi:hypothetical protein